MTAQLRVEDFDPVLLAARAAGLDAGKLEIRPPSGAGRAWTVNEIDRSWPTRVDAVAIDGATMQIVDRTHFSDFPLMAKLTRWGVDFHMGILFGLANQLLLIAFGIALCVMIAVGYRLWWIRRPARAAAVFPQSTYRTEHLDRASFPAEGWRHIAYRSGPPQK